MPNDNLTDRPVEIPPVTVPQPVGFPEFFRLPTRGVDPHFGLRRSFYYQLEKEGRIRFRRLRLKGNVRGVTLVVGQSVADFLRSGDCD